MKNATATKLRRNAAVSRPRAVVTQLRDAERTKKAILDAAKVEFAEKGLAGARVDTISDQSGANKRMLYYYFGSKEDLYLAVLEDVYGAMRQTESDLDLTHLEPMQALQRLIEFKFDYYVNNPIAIRIIAAENLHEAKFMKQSKKLRRLQVSLVEVLQTVLAAGHAKKLMKSGIDPVRLYISIAALSYFYFSNAATLSAAFDRPLLSPPELERWRDHAVQVITSYVRLP